MQLALIGGGLLLLVLGSQWLVQAAVDFARAMGVSDLVIGLTIVAAGTSMPEVATSVMAALRGQRDIAVGNVVGSNTFNILGCVGVSGLVASGGLPAPESFPVEALREATARVLADTPREALQYAASEGLGPLH